VCSSDLGFVLKRLIPMLSGDRKSNLKDGKTGLGKILGKA
jgi:hypothetical protein